jgi:hypothetical protein
MTTSAGVQDIGNVNFYSVENSEILGVAGSTTSATYSGGTPVSYQKYLFTGLKTMANNGGLSYTGDFEVRNGITSGVGGTLGVYFYGDVAGTSLIAAYILDKGSLFVRTESGTTASITGIPYTDGTQYTSYFLQTYDPFGGENRDDSLGQVSGRRPTPMPVSFSVTDTSDALVEKVLWIHNCGNGHPVHVGRSSRLLVGDSMVDSIPSVARGASDADSREGEQTGAVGEAGLLGGANATTGVVCVTGYRGSGAVLVSENSYFKTGVLFAKHLTLGFRNRFRGDYNLIAGVYNLQDSVLWVTDKSYAVLGGLVSLGNIVRPEIYGPQVGVAGSGGFYTGRTGRKWGAKDAVQLGNLDGAITSLYDSYIRLVGGVSLDGQTLGYVFHWDGGIGAAAQTANGSAQRGLCLLSTFWEGVIRLPPGSIVDSAPTTTAPQYIRYTQDARTAAAQKINTRSAAAGTVGHVYNTSGAVRYWLANTATGVSGAATGFAGLNGQHFSKNTDALTPPTTANSICSINVQGGRIFIG